MVPSPSGAFSFLFLFLLLPNSKQKTSKFPAKMSKRLPSRKGSPPPKKAKADVDVSREEEMDPELVLTYAAVKSLDKSHRQFMETLSTNLQYQERNMRLKAEIVEGLAAIHKQLYLFVQDTAEKLAAIHDCLEQLEKKPVSELVPVPEPEKKKKK